MMASYDGVNAGTAWVRLSLYGPARLPNDPPNEPFVIVERMIDVEPWEDVTDRLVQARETGFRDVLLTRQTEGVPPPDALPVGKYRVRPAASLVCDDRTTPYMASVPMLAFPFESVQTGDDHTYFYFRLGCAINGNPNPADITDVGDTGAGPDGQVDIEGILAFFNSYNSGDGCPGTPPCNLADVTDVGETGAGPDGQLTLDDILAFANAFNDGCE